MTSNRTPGKVAVVTGASSGIGAATARALALDEDRHREDGARQDAVAEQRLGNTIGNAGLPAGAGGAPSLGGHGGSSLPARGGPHARSSPLPTPRMSRRELDRPVRLSCGARQGSLCCRLAGRGPASRTVSSTGRRHDVHWGSPRWRCLSSPTCCLGVAGVPTRGAADSPGSAPAQRPASAAG